MKILTFLLTKTGALRWLAKTIAGLLSSWGVIGENNIALVSGAVLGILTAIADQLIEGKKARDAAKLQAGYGLEPDGWIGPVSRATIPGGEHNPNAEVRPAEPVRTQGRGRLGLILLFLVPTILLSGCATFAVQCTAHGVGGASANPYAYALLPFAVVFDIATSPFQFFYFAGMP